MVTSVALRMRASSGAVLIIRQPRTTGAALTMVAEVRALRMPSSAKKRSVSSMAMGRVASACALRAKPRRSRSGIGIGAAFLERRGISGARVDAVEPVDEVGPGVVEPGAVTGCLEREAHHNVGRGEALTGEPGAGGELGLEPV